MSDHGLRKTFREHLTGFDFLPVETGRTASGVPDLNFCKDGIEGWVEMKRAERGRVRVSPAQIGWVERRLDHGGRVFVAVRWNSTLRMYHGSQLRVLAVQRLDQVGHIYEGTGGPARWSWEWVNDILLRWVPFK